MTVSLQQLQEQFQAYMLDGDKQIEQQILSRPKAPAPLRLDVYRNGYSLRLLDILDMDYPMLKKMLGDKKFGKLGYAYIEAYPSKHFSIRCFGQYFSKFLQEQSAEPMLVEMADFEWAIFQSQDAADAPALTVEAMSKIAPEMWGLVRFTLHPSVTMMPFFYNVPEIWKALDKRKKKPGLRQHKKPVSWLLWRFKLESYFASLSEAQISMIKSMMAGKSFGDICEELCQWIAEDEVAEFAAGNLRGWIMEGVFSEVILPTEEQIQASLNAESVVE